MMFMKMEFYWFLLFIAAAGVTQGNVHSVSLLPDLKKDMLLRTVEGFFVFAIMVIVFPEAKRDKCDKKIDLAVVLDASASIGEKNFKLAKDFAKTLLRQFAISKDQVLISLVSYSQHVDIAPKFDDYYNETQLENALDSHFYESSSTSTGRALKMVTNDLFGVKGGARIGHPDVRKVVVVVTDGFSTTGVEFVKDKVRMMREQGIEVFAIGLTHRINEEELLAVSSTPVEKHLLRLKNAQSVDKIVKSIISQLCN